MIIAIDGPAASGKGTLGKQIAAHYGYHHLDTGSLYRAVALGVLQKGSDPAHKSAAVEIAESLDMTNVDDRDLRTAEVGNAASIVAVMADVRKAILTFQRRFAAQAPGTVLDGRDVGTVVCPDADVKLFVTASAETRANRRFLELNSGGQQVTKQQILDDLMERDRRDQEREHSPLKPAEDAHLLDTTELSIEAAFDAACRFIDSAIKAETGDPSPGT